MSFYDNDRIRRKNAKYNNPDTKIDAEVMAEVSDFASFVTLKLKGGLNLMDIVDILNRSGLEAKESNLGGVSSIEVVMVSKS